MVPKFTSFLIPVTQIHWQRSIRLKNQTEQTVHHCHRMHCSRLTAELLCGPELCVPVAICHFRLLSANILPELLMAPGEFSQSIFFRKECEAQAQRSARVLRLSSIRGSWSSHSHQVALAFSVPGTALSVFFSGIHLKISNLYFSGEEIAARRCQIICSVSHF